MIRKKYLKVEVTLLKDIGSVDDQREKAIDELIMLDYPNKISLEKMGIVYGKKNTDSILIANQQIGYQSQRSEQDSAAEDNYIVKTLNKITDRIAISQQGRYVINAEMLFDAKCNSHEDSIQRFQIKKYNDLDFVKAAGIKYFIEDEFIVGTFFFEPFFKDNRYYFVAFNFQPKEEVENFREAISFFRKYKSQFEKLSERMINEK